MNILNELKRKTLDAEDALDAFSNIFCNWQELLCDSENLTKALTLDLHEDNKMFIRSIIDISTTIESTYSELEQERDKRLLEYGIAKLGGNLGDLIDGIDHLGNNISIVLESFYLCGENVEIFGTRFLKSGRKGVKKDTILLDGGEWKIRDV
jgi:hypothetical protein